MSCRITGKPSSTHPSKSGISNTVQHISVFAVVDDEAVVISVRQTVLSVKDISEKQPGMCCLNQHDITWRLFYATVWPL